MAVRISGWVELLVQFSQDRHCVDLTGCVNNSSLYAGLVEKLGDNNQIFAASPNQSESFCLSVLSQV